MKIRSFIVGLFVMAVAACSFADTSVYHTQLASSGFKSFYVADIPSGGQQYTAIAILTDRSVWMSPFNLSEFSGSPQQIISSADMSPWVPESFRDNCTLQTVTGSSISDFDVVYLANEYEDCSHGSDGIRGGARQSANIINGSLESTDVGIMGYPYFCHTSYSSYQGSLDDYTENVVLADRTDVVREVGLTEYDLGIIADSCSLFRISPTSYILYYTKNGALYADVFNH